MHVDSLLPMATHVLDELRTTTASDWMAVVQAAAKQFDTPLIEFCTKATEMWEEFLLNPIPRPGYAEILFVAFMISNVLQEFYPALEFFFQYSLLARFNPVKDLEQFELGLMLLLQLGSVEEEWSWVTKVWVLSRCSVIYCLLPKRDHRLLFLCQALSTAKRVKSWDRTVMHSAILACHVIDIHRGTEIFGPDFADNLPSNDGTDAYNFTRILDALYIHQMENPIAN